MSRHWQPKPGLLQPGKASDRKVAESQGVDRATVISYRRRNGLDSPGRSGRPKGSGWSPDPNLLQPGEASDRKVATAQGVNSTRILRWRQRNGIPKWTKPGAETSG